MKVVYVVAALCACVAVSMCEAGEGKAEPREKVETAIPEAIRLLEAKEYVIFLTNFVVPDDFKKFNEGTTVEEFAKQFAEDKAAGLLAVLQAIKDAKPTMENDGKRAVYDLQEDLRKKVDGRNKIVFVKVEKYWYIEN